MKCKHGEFDPLRGCPQCIAELHEAGAAERMEQDLGTTNIVKVRYLSESTGELSNREYTYFTEESLMVGDFLNVPVRDTFAKAQVSKVNVPESEIEQFKDKVKTIPVGSLIDPMSPVEADLNEQIALIEMAVSQKLEEMQESPGTDIEVMTWHNEAKKLQEYAEAREIKKLDDLKAANNDLTIISKLKKVMEDRRKFYIRPLQDETKKINDTYKTLMAPVESADRITRGKMLAFNREQERIRREQEEINRKRMEAAEAEMKLKGELSEPVNLVEVVDEAPRKVGTDMGTSGMRDNWKYEIVDLSLLPREYMVPDYSMLNTIAKSHHDKKPVAGVRFYNEPIMAVRAR